MIILINSVGRNCLIETDYLQSYLAKPAAELELLTNLTLIRFTGKSGEYKYELFVS